jgi:hypothetical protein
MSWKQTCTSRCRCHSFNKIVVYDLEREMKSLTTRPSARRKSWARGTIPHTKRCHSKFCSESDSISGRQSDGGGPLMGDSGTDPVIRSIRYGALLRRASAGAFATFNQIPAIISASPFRAHPAASDFGSRSSCRFL